MVLLQLVTKPSLRTSSQDIQTTGSTLNQSNQHQMPIEALCEAVLAFRGYKPITSPTALRVLRVAV